MHQPVQCSTVSGLEQTSDSKLGTADTFTTVNLENFKKKTWNKLLLYSQADNKALVGDHKHAGAAI